MKVPIKEDLPYDNEDIVGENEYYIDQIQQIIGGFSGTYTRNSIKRDHAVQLLKEAILYLKEDAVDFKSTS